ncbi:MBL fold metallo-hydrolase [Clostridium oryzae]|uniref:Hydroxyacylglutathione hydrolase n=1 Tax=Clostridium oryzae TaxID=1450648 RepID=A0A1V4IKN6_9CLOT|nr:MBL fold metallo-hydrolase [Clostridium oryzae]OPJ60394.1 hydroxyacylglutathione hydrolase [Clostridium oryzae]
MSNWFTVEKIDHLTYAISEYKHWEQTHCYLLIGEKTSLLIDTGLGVADIKSVVTDLTDKPVQVVTTHVHWDHIGGHKYFNNIIVHEKEESWLNGKFPIPLKIVKSNLMKEPCDFPKDFDLDGYTIFQGRPTGILKDSDVIDLGGRKLEVYHTPGHSPGHICLYERSKGYLYSGDLIYEGTLYAFYPSTNPSDFMNSVSRMSKLNITRILPGHYSLDIPVTLINEIKDGFSNIYSAGNLKQGNGVFKFSHFNIHI